MGYAKSMDEGKTWYKTTGERYELPIVAATTEYAARIPQGHELINTTAMFADDQGRPYIATYWRREGATHPQYHLIYHHGEKWNISQISDRQTSFTLSGGGTKRIPISRPRLVTDSRGDKTKVYMLFRDSERGQRVSVAICEDLEKMEWYYRDLTDFSVDMWEPSYDTELWQREKELHIYVQKVNQPDGDAWIYGIPPEMIYILEWKPE
jgi:hypothetical protein